VSSGIGKNGYRSSSVFYFKVTVFCLKLQKAKIYINVSWYISIIGNRKKVSHGWGRLKRGVLEVNYSKFTLSITATDLPTMNLADGEMIYK